jgi:hypothetical protein
VSVSYDSPANMVVVVVVGGGRALTSRRCSFKLHPRLARKPTLDRKSALEMAPQVIPGQPLSVAGTSASLAAGPGTFVRGGKVYAALVGQVKREGGVRPTRSVS